MFPRTAWIRSSIAFTCGFVTLVGLHFIPHVLHRDRKWSLNLLPLSYILCIDNMDIYWTRSDCSKPFGPKPEIQHNQRGRGVPTLTWEEVTIREGNRRCCCCTKKEIIRLRNDSKLALNRQVKKCVYRVESYTIPYARLKRLRWPTSPAEKQVTYYTGVNVQSNHWTGSILGSSPYDLIDQH
jgi:hypothetical protein